MAAFAAVLFVIFIICLFALLFRKARPVAKWAGPASLVALIAAAVFAGQQDEMDAKRLGFLSASDQRAAREAGFGDATAWASKRSQVEEQKRRADAERLAAEQARAETARAEAAAAEARRQAALKPPVDQAAFVQALQRGRDQYSSGSNELQKGAARPARAKAICAAVKAPRIDGWVGKLAKLSTNSDGKGVLAISIGDDISLSTWNNSLSDLTDRTLIEPDSALYTTLLTLKVGTYVRVSGKLFPAASDCVREKSVTMDGSMRDPDFLVRISRVDPIDITAQR